MIKAKRSVPYIILIIATIVSIFPFLYMGISATNKSIDIINGKLLPGTYLIENLKNLLANQSVGTALWTPLNMQ